MNVSLTGAGPSLMATKALAPRLKAIALLPSLHQFCTGAPPATFRQPVMPAIAGHRCSHCQPPVPQVTAAMALPPALGGPWSKPAKV